jgi:hypothetical protein
MRARGAGGKFLRYDSSINNTAQKMGIGLLLSVLAASGIARRGDDAGGGVAVPQEVPAAGGGCAGRTANHRLDFWLGDWLVYAAGSLDGTSRIVSILGGCAVQEEWSDISGYQGRSWFYVDPSTGRLKQVWLTSHADQLGGTLEKSELPGAASGSMRFQGTLVDDAGKRMLDRTTLTLQGDGTVRQLIEISRDEGRTWSVKYDALYRHGRVAAPPKAAARR